MDPRRRESLAMSLLSLGVMALGRTGWAAPMLTPSGPASSDPSRATADGQLALPAGGLPVLENLALDYAGYLVTGMGATPLASARLTVQTTAIRYRINLRVESFLADLDYTSEGRIDAQGLHPEHYVEKRKIPFRRLRVKQVRYVVSAGQGQGLAQGGVPAQPGQRLIVPPGTQDRLSLLFQYALLARADATVLTPGHELSIPFAKINKVSPSRWSAEAADWIRPLEGEAEAAPRQAHKVARVADEHSSVDVAFWLGADARRLPLVLQFTENERSLRFVSTGVR